MAGSTNTQNALGQFQGNPTVGAITILVERTRMINGGRGVRGGRGISAATIRNVLHQQNKTTELWIADALLCAIGQPGALGRNGDAKVRVLPNPNADGKGAGCWC
jgi:hypothetical protein